MKITDVIVRKIYPAGKMKAVVSVTLDDVFVIHDVKVIQGVNGLFVAMPSRKMPDGTYKDICHPIDAGTRLDFQNCVFAAYEDALENEALEDEPVETEGTLPDRFTL